MKPADIVKFCRKHKSFLITTHHNPDADAIASALAMAMYLKSIGKKATVVNEDALPDWLKFLPGAASVKKASATKPFAYDAAIVLDCGDMGRIGGVQRLLKAGKPLVNIDHHITNASFGDINCVMPKASSTCEIVYDILKAGRFKMGRSLALLLYSGIMTDTGSFRYENTNAHTHAIAAELLSYGINADAMYRRLYVGMPVKDMKAFSQVIHNAQLLLGDRVYCVSLTVKDAAAFSTSFDLKEKIFNLLRSVEGIEVVVILTELGPRDVRVNLRSQGDADVATIASHFDGGGHKKAAGARIGQSLAIAQKDIMAVIKKQLKG